VSPSSLARARRERPEPRIVKVLERTAIGIASLALSIGLIALLSGFFAGRDQAGVSGTASGPGTAYVDLGHALLRPGERVGYDSIPPTSGPHIPSAVTRNGAALTDDQLLSALQVGDVVIMYGTPQPPSGLTKLVGSLAAPFSPALAATGQAVILSVRPGTDGLIGLAWTHEVRVRTPTDPLLRQFISFWLGRGAPGQLPSG
jgi:hypothetical protein